MSNFIEKMQQVCQKIQSRMDKVAGNEQATKDSLIKPFFNALGIDTEDPDSWVPEYKADMPGKKNPEKVDYAVLKMDSPIIFIEAKPYSNSDKNLTSRDGQLARYFNATPSVKLSIITNGAIYRFFTDLTRENVQDDEPFFVFDARNPTKSDIEVLEMFAPAKFELKTIRGWASDNKSRLKIQKFLYSILTKPEESKDFLKFVVEQTHEGMNTAAVRDSYSQKLSDLMKEAIDLCIEERLGLAKKGETKISPSTTDPDQIVTTVEELSTFYAVKGIITGSGREGSSVVYKDYQNWFNISLKRVGNWFVRLYFREDAKLMLVRLPFDKASQFVKETDKLQERSTGVVINLDLNLDLGPYAKLICEAFDACSTGKQGDSDGELVESELERIA